MSRVSHIFKNLSKTSSIGGKIRQFDLAVFDEGDWFAVALHRHHDVEARAAQIRDPRLHLWVWHGRDTAPILACAFPREPQIAINSSSSRSLAGCRLVSSSASSTSNRASGFPVTKASIVWRKRGISRASAIIVASTNSTPCGFSFT